jgi:hypothetical protein
MERIPSTMAWSEDIYQARTESACALEGLKLLKSSIYKMVAEKRTKRVFWRGLLNSFIKRKKHILKGSVRTDMHAADETEVELCPFTSSDRTLQNKTWNVQNSRSSMWTASRIH